MIDEFLQEITELQNCKRRLEFAEKDKAKMSDALYDLQMKEYNRTSYYDRVRTYIEETCSHCRDGCWDIGSCAHQRNLPEDIMKPMPSSKKYIPGLKGCGHFKWN